ncbi:MAG: NADH-quinone oxidoreductase subunit NuoE [Candidatus Acetothermia bacterium]
MQLQGATKEKLDEIIEAHEEVKTPLIQVLHKVQEQLGYIPPEVQAYLAKNMGIPQSEIYGVVSFYSFFDMEPQGDHLVTICTGTACYIKGAEKLIEAISDEYGIEMGETTEDRQFTLSSARCMGCCSLAPVALIDGEIHGNLTSGELTELLEELEGTPGKKKQAGSVS